MARHDSSTSRVASGIDWTPTKIDFHQISQLNLSDFTKKEKSANIANNIFYKSNLLVSYVGERPCWPLQSPNRGRKKRAKR